MRLRTLLFMASTALVPTLALAQAQAQAPAPGSQAQAPRPATQATSAAEFVNKAAASNLFEIQSSQLAQQKSQNNRVREFAQRMVRTTPLPPIV
jgi:putative membrane protein